MSKMDIIKEEATIKEANPLEIKRKELLLVAKNLGLTPSHLCGITKLEKMIADFKSQEDIPVKPQEVPIKEDNGYELNKANHETYSKYNDIDELNSIKLHLKEQVKLVESSALKNPTWQQHREQAIKLSILNQHIKFITIRIGDIKRNKQIASKKGKISQKTLKQVNLVRLIKEGKSLSVIIAIPDGISKNEIQEIITDEIVEECAKHRKDFKRYWNDWKNKYL